MNSEESMRHPLSQIFKTIDLTIKNSLSMKQIEKDLIDSYLKDVQRFSGAFFNTNTNEYCWIPDYKNLVSTITNLQSRLQSKEQECEELKADRKTDRHIKNRSFDFIKEDMGLIMDLADFIRENSGDIEISWTPGQFHISGKTRSSTSGDFRTCLKSLLTPPQTPATDEVE